MSRRSVRIPYFDHRLFLDWYARLWRDGNVGDPQAYWPQRLLQVVLFGCLGALSLPIVVLGSLRLRKVSHGRS